MRLWPITRSSRRLRWARGLAPGVILVATIACAESSGPSRVPTTVDVSDDSIALSFIGDSRTLSATATRGMAAVITPFAWGVREADVVHVTQSGQVIARAPGITWVHVVADSGGRDSTKVVVTQRVTRIELSPSSSSIPLPRTWKFQAAAFDAGGARVVNPPFEWSSTSSGIATVANDGLATATEVGSTTIRASVDGVIGEAALLVTPRLKLRIVPDTIDVGVGQQQAGWPRPSAIVTIDSLHLAEDVDGSASVADPTVAFPGASFEVPSNSGSPFAVTGLRTGVTTVIVSSPRYAPDTAVIRVSTPRLSIRLFGPTKELTIALGDPTPVTVNMMDSLGNAGRIAAPLTVTAISSDPGVARVGATRTPEAGVEWARVDIDPVSPGTATIVVSAPGYLPDSVFVTVVPPRLSFLYSSGTPLDVTTLGVGQRTWITPFIARSSAVGTSGLTISLSQKHPETLRLESTTITLGVWDRSAQIDFSGVAKGVDTVIATGAGHAPDTMIVHVTTPTYRVSMLTSGGTVVRRAVVGIHPADSAGLFHGQVTPSAARVTSSNPAVVKPVSDLITVGGMGLELDFLSVGSATLTFSDPSGLYVPVTSIPITVTPAEIVMEYETQTTSEVMLGMRQSLGPSPKPRVFVVPFADKPATVRVRSSNPSIVRPARNTVQMLEYDNLYVDLIAGDVSGRAWLIAEGDGMSSDSVAVVVSQPILTVRGGGTVLPESVFPVYVEARDSHGNLHAVAENLTVNLSVSNPASIELAVTTAVILAGASSTGPISVRSRRPGTAVVRAADPRPVSYRYEPGAEIITVRPPLPSDNLTPAAPR